MVGATQNRIYYFMYEIGKRDMKNAFRLIIRELNYCTCLFYFGVMLF